MFFQADLPDLCSLDLSGRSESPQSSAQEKNPTWTSFSNRGRSNHVRGRGSGAPAASYCSFKQAKDTKLLNCERLVKGVSIANNCHFAPSVESVLNTVETVPAQTFSFFINQVINQSVNQYSPLDNYSGHIVLKEININCTSSVKLYNVHS